jgi:hypothetical protein
VAGLRTKEELSQYCILYLLDFKTCILYSSGQYYLYKEYVKKNERKKKQNKSNTQLGALVHIFNSSTQEVEARGL